MSPGRRNSSWIDQHLWERLSLEGAVSLGTLQQRHMTTRNQGSRRKGLREFALTTAAIIAVLFGLFFPWLLERPIPRWPWVITGVLVVWGLAAPATLRPVYRGWMQFGLLLSKITTPIVMGVVFYVVITPMGLIRRLSGNDSLHRRFEQTGSYRVPSHKAPIRNLEKPF